MKNITAEERRLWMGDSHPKDLKITLTPRTQDGEESIILTNSDILSESLEISQILESKKTLTFGDVNASSLKFKCRDIEKDVRGWGLEAVLTFKEFPQYSRKVFKGILYTQNNQNHEDVTTSVVAYDPIKSIFALDLTDWWASLEIEPNSTFQTYCALVINKLASEVGCNSFSSKDIELLANLNQKIEAKPDLIADFKNVSGEMLIKWIAQACNVYIQYDAELDKLKAVKLKLMGEALVPNIGLHPRVGLYPSAGVQDLKIPKGEYITATYEPYKTEKIDQVIITDKGGIGEGQYPVQEEQGENVLFVDGNPFLWSMNMMECAEVIYNRVHDVYFTPSTIKTVGTVFMELGDVVRVSTVKNVINSYILKRTLKGINSIKDTFTNKSEQYQSPHNPSYADVTDLQAQSILRIQADIVEINSIVAQKATIKDLEVTNGRIDTIESDYVSTADLTATNARIKSLETDHVSTSDLSASNGRISRLETDHVSTSELTAIKGRVSTIESNYITASKVKSEYMEVTNWVSAGKIRADKIDAGTIVVNGLTANNITATLKDPSQGTLKIGEVYTSKYFYNIGNGNYTQMSCVAEVKWGGYTYKVMGYKK